MLIGEQLQVIMATCLAHVGHWAFRELTLRVSKIVRPQTIFVLIQGRGCPIAHIGYPVWPQLLALSTFAYR
jgi:hypothetical protein